MKGSTSFKTPSPNSVLESLGSSEGRLSTAITAIDSSDCEHSDNSFLL